MRILYISNYVDKKFFSRIFENANEKPIQSVQKFGDMFTRGLIEQNDVEMVDVISAAPINRNISKKYFWKGKNCADGKIKYTYVPFINIRVVKQMCLFFCSFLIVLFWCIRNIRKEKVLVFDGFYPIISTVSVLLCSFFNIMVIGLYTDIPKCMNHNIKHKNFFHQLTKFVVNAGDYINRGFSDAYILLTEAMNGVINKKGKPYIVMEGMVDISYLTNKKYNKSNAIMYAGGLYETYGVKMLIDAFIEWNNKDYELWLCGDGDLVDYIRKCKNKNIKYFGSLPNEKVVELEKKAKLLVNPRFTNEEYTKYSFPSKTMEYMLSGTAVLTTRLAGIPDEYNNFLYYIESETVDGLTSCFNKILSIKNDKKLSSKGEEAQQFVKGNKNNFKQSERVIEFIKKSNATSEKKRRTKALLNILVIISFLLIMFGVLLTNVIICKIGLLLFYASVTVIGILDYKKYLVLLVFLISFFVFGLGQYIFPNVTKDLLYYKNFDDDYVCKTMLIQYIALLFTYLGYNIVSMSFRKKNDVFCEKTKDILRKVFFVIVVFSLMCSIICNIELALLVIDKGYLSIYDENFVSSIPKIISKIGSYYYVYLSFYLPLIKNKRQLNLMLILLLINSIFDLLTGGRFLFMFTIIFIIFVYVYYNNLQNLAKKKIRKIVVASLICIPVLLISMSLYNKIRNKQSVDRIDPLYEIEAFFVSQGRSINLLTYSQIYSNSLKDIGGSYVFGSFCASINSKICMVSKDLCINNIPKERVNFGVSISKIVLGEKAVKAGNGLGTQYLSELYIDGGVLEIIFYSLLLGGLSSYLYLNSKNNYVCMAFMYYCIKPLLHIMRAGAFEMIAPFTSFVVLLTLALCLLLNRYIRRRA